jgi:hypothetical protein
LKKKPYKVSLRDAQALQLLNAHCETEELKDFKEILMCIYRAINNSNANCQPRKDLLNKSAEYMADELKWTTKPAHFKSLCETAAKRDLSSVYNYITEHCSQRPDVAKFMKTLLMNK